MNLLLKSPVFIPFLYKSNIVRKSDQGCNCSANSDVRVSYNLIEQFELASLAAGTTDSLFIAAEVAYDQASDK